MNKIVPLVSLIEVDNYISNGVDSVLMGTLFGSTRQERVYDLEEIIDTNAKIPVIAMYNRFYFEQELEQLKDEIKALHDGGIDHIMCTDMAVIQIVNEEELDLKIIYNTDTTMTNAEDIQLMLDKSVDEVIVSRELTFDERLEISKNVKGNLGMHFFGYQLMSFSRRKHLSQYKDLSGIEIETESINYLKEVNRDDLYMTFEDTYGTHMFAPNVLSMIHLYDQLKASNYKNLYFETININIDDVLFVIRNIDMIEDYKEFEEIVRETSGLELDHGLLYSETDKGKVRS